MSDVSDFPRAWYWRRDNGAVYSSSAEAIVPVSDPTYAAWLASGLKPTVWPSDDAGAQTDAVLKAVLNPYGIWLDAAAVPASVSRAQAKIALHRAGLLDAVKTAVAGDPEMQIWFDDATTWDRDNPHVVALGEGALALPADAIDALFVTAAQIQA